MKNIIYEDPTLGFKLRTRGERNIEVCYYFRPGVWFSTGTKDRKEALRNVKKKLSESFTSPKIKKGITLKEYADKFFLRTDSASIRKRNENFNKRYEDSYYEANQSRLDNYIIPRFGGYRIDCITDLEVEAWYSSLCLMSGKPASDATKVKVLDTFSAVMDKARRDGVIKENPIRTVERVTVINKSREPFTAEEIRKLSPISKDELLRIWGTLQWALYFSIMIDTGWRAGEVSALRRCDFRFNGVYSERSVDNRTRKVKDRIKTTGKGQSYKVGILSDYTLDILADYLHELPPDEEYLFRMGESGELCRCEVSNKHLKASLERAGIPVKGRTQHCFRHSFDTDLLNEVDDEIEEKDVRELMAHVGYQATYDHRTPEDHIQRLGKVQRVLNKRRVV